jgi:hypothetical protein
MLSFFCIELREEGLTNFVACAGLESQSSWCQPPK